MEAPRDSDATLPSVITASRNKRSAEALLLTIAFHPDVNRIGEVARVEERSASRPWILGRRSPAFKQPGAPAAGSQLAEPHISRQSLQLEYRRKALRLRRFPASSRVRVGAVEVQDALTLNTQELRAGVPILLGHGVVLLLRLAPVGDVDATSVAPIDELRGQSAAMAAIRAQVMRAAACDVDVLIRGETGTGKELVASAIHRLGARARGPWVVVNMAAIPTELAAAALFGRNRGAYTGADSNAPGYFQQAHRGCLFLDEVGDTAEEVQPQLLRALQQREIQPVGGAVTKVDLRVLSATDALLDSKDSHFKAALRHRLGALEIVLPALREHPEDIGELLLHFLRSASAAAGNTVSLSGTNGRAASAANSSLLPTPESDSLVIAAWANLFFHALRYQWPGNVRELANVAHQIIVTGASIPDLPQNFTALHPPSRNSAAQAGMSGIDHERFAAAMQSADFEVVKVARALGVSRAAVYRRIEASKEYRLLGDISDEEVLRSLTEHKGETSAAARELRVSPRALAKRLRKLAPAELQSISGQR